ncbi:MAG: RNA polymerase sigma factor [Kiritimatiellae bacterium]|nr:RNA polymerase sigma factor [Kiritimatiellia bacterium]
MPADPQSRSDEELMLAVQDGDLDAFETLVERYRDRLAGFVYHHIGSYSAVPDILQDIFVQVHRAAPRYEPRGKFGIWLFTIARAVCINALKKKLRRAKRITDRPLSAIDANGTSLLDRTPADTEAAPESMARQEEFKKVRQAIESLPDIYRDVVILRQFQELSYRDISAILQVPEGALRVRMHQAIELMRKAYFEENG